MTHSTVKLFEVLGRISQVSTVDTLKESEPTEESILELIRRVGNYASEEIRRDLQAIAPNQKVTSDMLSHSMHREMSAHMVLRSGYAATIKEARKMVDEAI